MPAETCARSTHEGVQPAVGLTRENPAGIESAADAADAGHAAWRRRPAHTPVPAPPARTQQQPSAAHVTASHELRGEQELPSEHLRQHIDVFAGRDAAQQHDFVLRPQPAGEHDRVANQRPRVSRFLAIDRHAAHLEQVIASYRRRSRQQALARRDDQHAPRLGSPLREPRGIGELAPKVQAAHERERVAQRDPFRPQPASQFEARAVTQEVTRPLPGAVGRRKQKYATHGALYARPYEGFLPRLARVTMLPSSRPVTGPRCSGGCAAGGRIFSGRLRCKYSICGRRP